MYCDYGVFKGGSISMNSWYIIFINGLRDKDEGHYS